MYIATYIILWFQYPLIQLCGYEVNSFIDHIKKISIYTISVLPQSVPKLWLSVTDHVDWLFFSMQMTGHTFNAKLVNAIHQTLAAAVTGTITGSVISWSSTVHVLSRDVPQNSWWQSRVNAAPAASKPGKIQHPLRTTRLPIPTMDLNKMNVSFTHKYLSGCTYSHTIKVKLFSQWLR